MPDSALVPRSDGIVRAPYRTTPNSQLAVPRSAPLVDPRVGPTPTARYGLPRGGPNAIKPYSGGGLSRIPFNPGQAITRSLLPTPYNLISNDPYDVVFAPGYNPQDAFNDPLDFVTDPIENAIQGLLGTDRRTAPKTGGRVQGPKIAPPPEPIRAGYGPYGAPIGPGGGLTFGTGFATNKAIKTLTGTYDDVLAKADSILQLDIDDIKAQYSGPMSELQKVLDDLAAQGDLSAAAYGRYSKAVAAIDPSVTVEGISDTDAPELVKGVYDDAEGAFKDALVQIDANLGPEAVTAVTSDLRIMEDTIQDQLRTDIDNVDALHAAAALEVTRFSELAYAGNLYETAKESIKLQAQVAKNIEDQKDAIAKLKAEMASAIERTKERALLDLPDFDLQYDESYQASLRQYFLDKGLTEKDVGDMLAAFDEIKGMDPSSLLSEATWGKALTEWNNVYILSALGLEDDLMTWQQGVQNGITTAMNDGDTSAATALQRQLNSFDSWMQSANLGAAFQGDSDARDVIFGRMTSMGAITPEALAAAGKLGDRNTDDWMVKGDDQWNGLRDVFTFNQAFDKNWAKIKKEAEEKAAVAQEIYVQSISGGGGGGRTAPNNAANKNEPAYVYRRTVTAPYYAELVKNTFPGTQVGALGYVRDVNDVGNGRIVNSDHQSGGAIDVYNRPGSASETNQTLLKMAQWFRGQPGVAYVTYEDQNQHQTGNNDAHIHVSFQVGWQVP